MFGVCGDGVDFVVVCCVLVVVVFVFVGVGVF